MRQRGTWGCPEGPTMPPHHVLARGTPWPRQGQVWGPLALHYLLFLSFSFSLPKNTIPLFEHEFLLLLLAIFDLLAQPIIPAEIWSICSSVRDSSIHPSGILFGGLYLEYFAVVGDRLSEVACLFYASLIIFDACLALL